MTGNKGEFCFENVESGHHSLTALRDGKVVGYMEFELTKGTRDLLFSVLDDGTVRVDVPNNVLSINFDLEIKDGALKVNDVKKAVVSSSKGTSPMTGDSGYVFGLINLLNVSSVLFVAIVIIILMQSRKRTNNMN